MAGFDFKSLVSRLTTPLCFKPRVFAAEGKLRARTSVVQQVLSLFSYRREVLVDSETEIIQVNRRVLWFWRKSWEIPFAAIKRIDYGFSDAGGELFRAVIEFYTVSLVLAAAEDPLKLFTFVGEFSEPATSLDLLLYGEKAAYWGSEGGQAASSQEFVQLLQHYTGAPLV